MTKEEGTVFVSIWLKKAELFIPNRDLVQPMIETDPSRIFLVDDHSITREGMRSLLESDESFTVVGEAGSGEEAVEKLSETESDLAVVDISMEGMDGIELTRRLTGAGSKRGETDLMGLPVLIVSIHDEIRYVEAALEAGAQGYLLKDDAHGLLLEAIRTVLDGELYLCPEIEKRLNR